MNSNKYMMYVSTPLGKNPNDEIESALGGMGWARLRGGDVYLISTKKTATEVRDMIRPLLGDNGHILVMEVNLGNRSGFLATGTVEWLRKQRDSES